MIGGLSYEYTVLGVYLWSRFGCGPYKEAVHVAVYMVHFPIVAVLVGLMQMGMGVYGFLRAIHVCSMNNKDDYKLFHVTCATWIVTTILQCPVEPSYGAGETFQAEGATIASVYVGFFLMPVYLDHLVRTTPLRVNPQDYGLSPDAPAGRPDFLVTWVYGNNNKEQRPSPPPPPPPQEQDDKYPFS